ncbi:MAG: serine hydrolase [Pseudomonadota bacterium]
MSILRRRSFIAIMVILVVLSSSGLFYLNRTSVVVGGYVARDLCVEVFYNDKDVKDAQAANFSNINAFSKFIRSDADLEAKTVSSGLGPFRRSHAVFYEGYGCVVERGSLPDMPDLASVTDAPLPEGDPAALGFDPDALKAALDNAFDQPFPYHRAVLVMRNGQIAAERYAPGYDANTIMMSASMAKSVTATMIGAAVHEGLIDITDRAPISGWADPDDPRSSITWIHLLQMQTGLEFDEGGMGPFKDRSIMNVLKRSAAEYAIDKPLIHEPGTEFAYATGTSNILQRALRNALEAQGVDYHRFGNEQIFGPLGMESFIFLTDSVGDFIGGSVAYATARDWAKLGQLYLQDGRWDGEQILHTNWVQSATTPADQSDRSYGFQIWLNNSGKDERQPLLPNVPEDALMFWGAFGQLVVTIPSLDLVIVHLGRIYHGNSEATDPDTIFGEILEAVRPSVHSD